VAGASRMASTGMIFLSVMRRTLFSHFRQDGVLAAR
jgi:hypothetical protein